LPVKRRQADTAGGHGVGSLERLAQAVTELSRDTVVTRTELHARPCPKLLYPSRYDSGTS